MASSSYLILSGDIGGTNTRLSLFQVGQEEATLGDDTDVINHKVVFHKEYKNAKFSYFTDAVYQFFQDAERALGPSIHASNITPKAACIAVAGPVTDDRVTMTNIGWCIDGRELERIFDIDKARLINDFLANGYGLLTLQDKQSIDLKEGEAVSGAPIACLGAGTGLGVVYLTANADGQYEAFASEGGHVEYAPRNQLEQELQTFLQKKFGGRISAERVVSGKGIVNIYEFLRNKYPDKVTKKIDSEIMSAASEGAAVIGKYLYDDALCKQAFDIFFRAYGSCAGNLGLQYLPFGGIYIAGGIILKSMESVTKPANDFIESFQDKGRVSGVLKNIPLKVVTAEDLGMRGAHVVATRELQKLLGTGESTHSYVGLESVGSKSPNDDSSSLMFAVGAAGIVLCAIALLSRK